jgi:hypothetical protein
MFPASVAGLRSWVSGQLAGLTRPKFCGRFRSGQTEWSEVAPLVESFTPCLLDDLLGDVLRGFGVGVELH